MSASPRSVVIVGAGFCGTTLAVNLLRLAGDEPLNIILIERAQFARGLAYARLKYPYLLNVPAGRMSATTEDPGEFLRFARRSYPHAGASDFLPRELYGEYLEWLLRSAERGAPAGTVLQRLVGVAVAVERLHRRAGFRLHLEDGRSVHADDLVLATGNPPPAPLPGHERLRTAVRYVPDPWQAPPRFQPGESVLLVGTGLTMADVVLAGLPREGQRVRLHALSRRGLLPAAQTPFTTPGDIPARLESLLNPEQTHASLVGLSRDMRQLAQELVNAGDDWRKLIAGLREFAPQLWQRMPAVTRRRFVTHLRPYWDVHRHRIPAGTAAALQGLQQDGQLQVHAGRILGFDPLDRQVQVHYRPRGARTPETMLVDRIINCTGPNYDVTQTQDRLLRGLLAQGVATADPLRLGLVTDGLGRLVGAHGNPAGNLYYIGPLLRARDWESTAASELRVHAWQLARHLCAPRPAAAEAGRAAPPFQAAALTRTRTSQLAERPFS